MPKDYKLVLIKKYDRDFTRLTEQGYALFEVTSGADKETESVVVGNLKNKPTLDSLIEEIIEKDYPFFGFKDTLTTSTAPIILGENNINTLHCPVSEGELVRFYQKYIFEWKRRVIAERKV